MTAKSVLTYADYVALPEDGKRYQILDGELYVTPAPSLLHQIVAGNLVWRLENYVRPRACGKVLSAPAYAREESDHSLVMGARGADPCGPPPFPDLGLVVDTLWV